MRCCFPYLGIAGTKKSWRELHFRYPATKHEGASAVVQDHTLVNARVHVTLVLIDLAEGLGGLPGQRDRFFGATLQTQGGGFDEGQTSEREAVSQDLGELGQMSGLAPADVHVVLLSSRGERYCVGAG
jgi:hypothetical protein